jgi:hypothetical protein
MRLNAFSFLVIFVVASILIVGFPVQALTAQWPMEEHDLSRRGLSPYSPVAEGPGVMWKVGLGNDWSSALLIGADGTIYTSVGGTIFALDPNGKILWSNQSSKSAVPKALTDTGDIMVLVHQDLLILDHENGKEIWRYQRSAHQYIDWAVSLEDGSLLMELLNDYGSSFSFQLDKLTSQRTLDWQLNLNGNFSAPASVSPNGTIFFNSITELRALYPNGKPFWNATIPGYYESQTSPILAEDGTIYVHARSVLSAFSPNGSIKWYVYLPTSIGSCSLDRSGNIVAGLVPGWVYSDNSSAQQVGPSLVCISPDGSILWKRWLPDSPGGGCTCTQNGLIYFAGSNSLMVLDENGTMLWQYEHGYVCAPPVISANGTVYFTVLNDKSDILYTRTNLYAIRGEVGPSPVVFELVVVMPVIILLALIIRSVFKSKRRGNAPPPRDDEIH